MSERTCTAPGCEKPTDGRKLCDMHAWRFRKFGKLEPYEPRPPSSDRPCAVPGCEKWAAANGDRVCSMHRSRMTDHGSYDKSNKPRKKAAPRPPRPRCQCSIADCTAFAKCRGLCIKHYTRFRRTGTPHRHQVFFQRPHSQGYLTLNVPGHPLTMNQRNTTVYVHRLVLFDSIGFGPHQCHWCSKHVNWGGRYRPDALEADHLDRNRANNDPVNLAPSCHACNTRRGRRIGPKGQFLPAA